MPTGVEVAKVAIDDFKKIQEYMHLAKEEGATKTYEIGRASCRERV